MLERQVLEPVFGARGIDQITGKHRVGVEPAQRDAVAREEDRVELQIVSDLPNAGIFEQRPQPVEYGLERHRRDLAERVVAHRDVIRVSWRYRERKAHD